MFHELSKCNTKRNEKKTKNQKIPQQTCQKLDSSLLVSFLCATKKRQPQIFFFRTSNVQNKKKNVRNRTKQFMSTFFLSNKKKESTCCKTVGGKFQTIFKATAKILHHRLPHKVRQSGGFYFSFFFYFCGSEQMI